MPKKNIHTTYKDGGWRTIQEGRKTPLSSHSTKDRAIKASIKQAKKDEVEHIIHGKDGKIQDKDSYGKDPMPPRDRIH